MKKIILPVLALLAANSFGQVFTHDFEGGTPLAGWTTYGTTGVSIYASDAGITGLGLGGTTFWAVDNAISGTSIGTNKAFTTSWFTTVVTADNYLITPSIALPGGDSYKVSWNAESFGNASYLDPYKVVISGTGTAKTDFTTTLYTNTSGAPNSGGENIEAFIPGSFSGGNVYIAFVATGEDDYVLAFDDVTVEVVSPVDMAMTALNVEEVIPAGAYTISGTVKNNGGDPITSFDVEWNDGGSPNSQTFTATLNPGDTYNWTHTTTYTAVSGSTGNIEACVVAAGDGGASNDCMDQDILVASGTATRLALMETFTSSTCPPCYSLATSGFGGSGLGAYYGTINANDETGAGAAAISYQVDWPGAGDHAYNADVDTRVSYYSISGAPTTMVDAGPSGLPSYVDAANAVPAYLDIAATHSTSGGTLTVNVTVNPYISVTGAKVHIALLDHGYEATSASSFSNGETEFHHVLRKMLPNGNGTTASFTDGTPYTLTETYDYTFNASLPAQGSYDLHAESTQEVVVFVQDADGKILNSAISSGTFLGEEEINDLDFNVSVYPNPTSEMTNISITVVEQSDVNVEIFNTVGELVYINNNESVTAGNYILPVDISEFAAGTYVVKTTVNEAVQTTKLMVK